MTRAVLQLVLTSGDPLSVKLPRPKGASTVNCQSNGLASRWLDEPSRPSVNRMVICSPTKKSALGLSVRTLLDRVLVKAIGPRELPEMTILLETEAGFRAALKRRTTLAS